MACTRDNAVVLQDYIDKIEKLSKTNQIDEFDEYTLKGILNERTNIATLQTNEKMFA